MAWITSVAEPAAASVPTSQPPVIAEYAPWLWPWPAYVTPGGSSSVTTTPDAEAGPWFTTVTVQERRSPG
ncbi:MAG: hypothetical protein U0167_08135 [bacterium]